MSTIVYSAGEGRAKGHMAVGLRWVVLDQGAKRRKDGRIATHIIRTQARTIAASKFVVLQSGMDTAAGFYSDPVVAAPPRLEKVYSLSMLFLSAFLRQRSDTVVNAALLMQTDRNIDKRAVVIILGGQVTLDTLLDTEKALERVNDEIRNVPGISVFCQSPEISATHTIISWEDITALTDKEGSISRLQPVPASAYLIPAVAMVAVVIGGTVSYDQMVRKPEARQRALAQAVKADRTPAYVAAVDLALQRSGWSTGDLKNHVDALRQYPMFTKGWALESLACDGAQCLARWERRGGTLATLQTALPSEKLLMPGSDESPLTKGAVATLERAFTTRPLAAQYLASSRDKLQTKNQALLSLYSPMQKLSNAGLSVSIGEPSKWDGFDASGVTASEILLQMPISITAPYFRAHEVLSTLPTNVFLKSFLLNTADGAMTINFKGFVYARQ